MNNRQAISPLNLLSRFLSMGATPQQIEQTIFNQYPNFRILSNQMKQSGMNPIEFAMQIAKQYNIPIQQTEISNTFSQMWNMISNKKY